MVKKSLFIFIIDLSLLFFIEKSSFFTSIIGKKEAAKQNAEMSRFGAHQVERFLEKQKMATEEAFTSSLVDAE